ncbi:MAG TPA: UDP-2,3-diacylglucosamine diphosphatase LpxI [Ferrovibrio sp.]|jgi:DUF1009 family protein|uniref:LpxI family protein n=1 Tax=Ferrovibrio sp. TaxID=1917215 RepID=UPI002ED498CB
MAQPLPKLGLIAGGGQIPALVRDICSEQRRELFIAALNGFCDPATIAGADHDWFDLPRVGRLLNALHTARVEQVCLCGRVSKPDFATLKPDWKGALLLPKIIKAARFGDDAILRVVVEVLEKEGFGVVGVEQIVSDLLVQNRPYSGQAPTASQWADIRIGIAAARELGRADRGQGVIVSSGVVVAQEDDAGTDAMLRRMKDEASARQGVLVKCAKPQQDRRVDLPTVGATTIENAAAAGLAGVAVEAGAALMVDAAGTASAADKFGLFLIGFDGDG